MKVIHNTVDTKAASLYALPLAPIEAKSPVKLCVLASAPDLQRIAGYAEVKRNE